jgi:hypothetical protein
MRDFEVLWPGAVKFGITYVDFHAGATRRNQRGADEPVD